MNKHLYRMCLTKYEAFRPVSKLVRMSCLALLFAFLCNAPYWVMSAKAESNSSSVLAETTEPLCRFGVNAAHGGNDSITDYDIAALRVGWYINYQATATSARPGGIEYAPMIRLSQTGSVSYTFSPSVYAITQTLAANPGATWFVGNEPDRRQFQDDLEPKVYAIAYHDMYKLIKSYDPTAQVFAGSIVQPTPLRIQYLDLVLQSYIAQYGSSMPVDGWSIHNFILNEASCEHYNDLGVCWGADIPPGISAIDGLRIELKDNDNFTLFKEQIVRFRDWMAKRGYRDTPLFLSEYGVLMPNTFAPPADFPPSRVNSFMTKTFDYLISATDPNIGFPSDTNHLVQRWSWYSTNDSKDYNGYLFERASPTDPYHTSPMGDNYRTYTSGLSNTVDLLAVELAVNPSAPLVNSAPVTFTLTAKIANAGNLLQQQNVKVRFYDGNPSQGGQPIGSEQTVSLAGCGESVTASVAWKNIPKGEYTVYVQVDPANTVLESNEQNNLTSRKIFFATNQVFLPSVHRGF